VTTPPVIDDDDDDSGDDKDISHNLNFELHLCRQRMVLFF